MTLIRARYYINGVKVANPVAWRQTKLIATFDALTNQSQVDTDRVEFILDGAQEVIKYFEAGTQGGRGITEGLPVKIELDSEDGTQDVFKGYIDFFKDYEQINAQKVMCTLSILDDIAELKQRMAGITVDLLIDKGVYNKGMLSSVEWVVEKEFDYLELATLLLTIYILLKEIYEAALRLANLIATIAGILAGGITGSVGSVIFAGLAALAELAYIALMIIQVVDLVENLFTYFLSPKRKLKIVNWLNLVSKAVEYLGYTFSTDIEELSKYYFLPSLKGDNLDRGFPNPTDRGYTIEEMISVVEETFYTKINIIDDVFYLNWEGSDFWNKSSGLILDKQSQDKRSRFKTNINDIRSVDYIQFVTDVSDVYTSKNFTGTNYEITTEQNSVGNRKTVGVKGLNQVLIPYALGNQKTGLNDIENTLSDVAGIADELLSIFGQGSNLKQSIQSRIGALKTSGETFDNAKMLYISGGKIPTNHRAKLSAKVIWEKYHTVKSFVTSNTSQRLLYADEAYPLTLREFNTILGNNQATDWKDRRVNISKLLYSFDADTAEIEYDVIQKYTSNLKETKIEG